MLVAIVVINSLAGTTYDVEVKRTEGATVEEGSAAISEAKSTKFITRRWLLEKKGVLWVQGVVYHVRIVHHTTCEARRCIWVRSIYMLDQMLVPCIPSNQLPSCHHCRVLLPTSSDVVYVGILEYLSHVVGQGQCIIYGGGNCIPSICRVDTPMLVPRAASKQHHYSGHRFPALHRRSSDAIHFNLQLPQPCLKGVELLERERERRQLGVGGWERVSKVQNFTLQRNDEDVLLLS